MDFFKVLKDKRGNALYVLLIVLVIVLLVIGFLYWRGAFNPKPSGPEFQKGIGYVTWGGDGYLGEDSDESMARMKQIGTDWVSILITWYQTDPWSSDIHMSEQTPSDESVVHAIRTAHELGMKVMLKPHLDLLNQSDGSWRGEIGCLKEEGWDEWFRQYEAFLAHYLKIAQKEKVEMFCLGTELSCTATVKGYMWEDLIKKARSKYKGQLTYAAHWDSYQDIRFWDKLDYVGINAYFPLTEKLKPTMDELMEGWKKWVTEMEEFQKTVNKPIIFPEIGCNSADGAAIRPWEHVANTEVNLGLQEDYYKALLNTFWDKEWFYGLYWWYWGTNIRMGGTYNRSFTPQNKPAENVVKEWYEKPSPR